MYKKEEGKLAWDFTLKTEKSIPNSFIQSVEDIISIFGNNHILSFHRKLEEKVSEKFIYDPLILGFTDLDSPLDVLIQMQELGGNVLIRKIEYTPSIKKMEISSLTIYLSVIKMDSE